MQSSLPNLPNVSVRNLTRAVDARVSKRKEEKIVEIDSNRDTGCRVLIVDRDSMASDLLAHALTSDPRFEAVAIHSNDLLYAISTSEADLVIISDDVKSDSGSGFSLAETVIRASPETRIVMLLNHVNQKSIFNAFRAGARGVFSRQQSMAEFLDCVEHVRKGFIWAGKDETKSLLEILRTIPAPSLVSQSDLPDLTTREREVVHHAARGKTNKTIASELGLSEHTVKNYLFRAFAKLGVSSRVELLFHLTNGELWIGAETTKDAEDIYTSRNAE